jgi:hypothetical protein
MTYVILKKYLHDLMDCIKPEIAIELKIYIYIYTKRQVFPIILGDELSLVETNLRLVGPL